jgi:hypothetical protein
MSSNTSYFGSTTFTSDGEQTVNLTVPVDNLIEEGLESCKFKLSNPQVTDSAGYDPSSISLSINGITEKVIYIEDVLPSLETTLSGLSGQLMSLQPWTWINADNITQGSPSNSSFENAGTPLTYTDYVSAAHDITGNNNHFYQIHRTDNPGAYISSSEYIKFENSGTGSGASSSGYNAITFPGKKKETMFKCNFSDFNNKYIATTDEDTNLITYNGGDINGVEILKEMTAFCAVKFWGEPYSSAVFSLGTHSSYIKVNRKNSGASTYWELDICDINDNKETLRFAYNDVNDRYWDKDDAIDETWVIGVTYYNPGYEKDTDSSSGTYGEYLKSDIGILTGLWINGQYVRIKDLIGPLSPLGDSIASGARVDCEYTDGDTGDLIPYPRFIRPVEFTIGSFNDVGRSTGDTSKHGGDPYLFDSRYSGYTNTSRSKPGDPNSTLNTNTNLYNGTVSEINKYFSTGSGSQSNRIELLECIIFNTYWGPLTGTDSDDLDGNGDYDLTTGLNYTTLTDWSPMTGYGNLTGQEKIDKYKFDVVYQYFKTKYSSINDLDSIPSVNVNDDFHVESINLPLTGTDE